MIIAIFGGAGRTGRHLVEQSLGAGHTVRALARNPDRLALKHERLTVIQGGIDEAGKVEQTVAEAEAVISVLGPSSNRPERAVSEGMDNIVAAMRRRGLRRLIVTAGAAVRDPQDQPTLVHAVFGGLVKRLSRHVYEDMAAVVDKVRASGLDWTVVRVPMLTDGPATGGVRAGYVGKDIGPRLARADLARFLLEQVEAATWVGKAPAVSN